PPRLSARWRDASRQSRVAPMSGPVERRWAQIAGVALIVVTSFLVLRPFFVPIAWAAILAYASWPLHTRIDQAMGGRLGLSALAMTMLMVIVVIVPAGLVSAALVVEIQNAYDSLRSWLPRDTATFTDTITDNLSA